MASVQPFSYLTGEAPPKKSGFRKPEESYGTGLQFGEGEEQTAPARTSPTTLYVDDVTRSQNESSYTSQPEVNGIRQVPDGEHKRIGAEVNGIRQVPDGEHKRIGPEVNVIRLVPDGEHKRIGQVEAASEVAQQLETSYVKKPPEVAQKPTNDQWQQNSLPEMAGRSRPDVSNAIQFNPLQQSGSRQSGRSKPEEPGKVPMLGANKNLHAQVKRHRPLVGGITSPTHDIGLSNGSPPSAFAQQHPPGPGMSFADLEFYGSDHSSSKSDLHDKTKEREKASPQSSAVAENLSIFENFILVGPGKKETRTEETVQKEPIKRLKLQELFDPPPPRPPPPSNIPGKVSILGVTSTESSDFHNSPIDNSKSRGPVNGKSTGPVSTFDNPDYNISSAHGFSEDRSWSAWTPAGNIPPAHGEGAAKAGETPVSQKRMPFRCQGRLCAAILITAVISAVICFGAGFIAGWFGKGKG